MVSQICRAGERCWTECGWVRRTQGPGLRFSRETMVMGDQGRTVPEGGGQ